MGWTGLHPIVGGGRLPRCSGAPPLIRPRVWIELSAPSSRPASPPPKTPPADADLGRIGAFPDPVLAVYRRCGLACPRRLTPPPPPPPPLIWHVERPLHAGSSRGGGAGRAAPGMGVAQGSPARPYPFLPSIAAHARVVPPTGGPRLQRPGLVAARGTADGSTIPQRSPSPPHSPPLLPPYQELVREAPPRARLAARPPTTATPSAS